MSRWNGTFDIDIEDEILCTDGTKNYEVFFGIQGKGFQEGHYFSGTMYNKWGDPGDPPESEIEDAGVIDYAFTYCEAYELEHGEVISEDSPYYRVFIDKEEGINLDNCGEEERHLFDSLRTVGRKPRSFISAIESMLDDYCWNESPYMDITDSDYFD